MKKAVEEMSIAELEKVIEQRKRLKKKVPALRKEREKLLASIAQIDKQLAMAGPAPALKRRAKPAAKAPRRAVRKAVAAPKTRKRAPRGQVQNAIFTVLGRGTMGPAAIADEVLKRKLATTSKKTLSVIVHKMAAAGKLAKVGPGLYKKA